MAEKSETKDEELTETVKEEKEQSEAPKGLPESLRKFIQMEEPRMRAPMPKVEIDSLSTRSYLDHTVVPIMMDAMSAVAKLRPPDPIEYVAVFLLKNKDKYKEY